MSNDYSAFLGKVYGADFSLEDLQKAFPQYKINILKHSTLFLAGSHKPDRLRVWLDADGKVTKLADG